MTRWICVVSLALMLSACQTITPKEAATESVQQLCEAYGTRTLSDSGRAAITAELQKRNVFSDAEWAVIYQHTIFAIPMGATADVVVCTIGAPERINSSQVAVAGGVVAQAQFVYYGSYVYFQLQRTSPTAEPDWRVSGIQD